MSHRVVVCPLKRCKPLLHAFDYTHDTPLPAGTLVEIPFRRTNIHGIVVDPAWAQPPSSRITISPIIRVVAYHYFPASALAIAEAIARIAATSLSNILCGALPKTFPQEGTVYPAQPINPATTHPVRIDSPRDLPGACWDTMRDLHGAPVLIVVPQIEDAHDIETHSPEHIPVKIISQKLSRTQWNAFRGNPPPIVIATRRGILLPYHHQPHLIVYRSGSPLFIQDLMNPHYDPLDVVTAVPHAFKSVTYIETSAHLKTLGFHSIVRPTTQAKAIVSVTQSYSPEAIIEELIESTRKSESQPTAIIVHNKGDARRLICTTCNTVATCPRCQNHVGMSGTPRTPRLACDLCGAVYQRFGCLGCGASTFRPLGIGVKTISRMFEAKKIDYALMVVENSTTPPHVSPVAHLTVGTIAQISHYKKGTLPPAHRIIIPDADTFFSYSNTDSLLSFRHMVEECISLGAQEVCVFTRTPAHPFFQSLIALDTAFLHQEAQLRERFHYPPYCWVYTLTHLKREALHRAIEWVYALWGAPGYAVEQSASSLILRIPREPGGRVEDFFTFLKHDMFRDSIVSASASYEEKTTHSPHRARA